MKEKKSGKRRRRRMGEGGSRLQTRKVGGGGADLRVWEKRGEGGGVIGDIDWRAVAAASKS